MQSVCTLHMLRLHEYSQSQVRMLVTLQKKLLDFRVWRCHFFMLLGSKWSRPQRGATKAEEGYLETGGTWPGTDRERGCGKGDHMS